MKLRTLLPALLGSAALLVPLVASAQAYHQTRPVSTRSGVIASVQGSHFLLRNGTTVYLHRGLAINPTGTSLRPGMRVRIRGSYNGIGVLNARSVAVRGTDYAYSGGKDRFPHARFYRNGWYDGGGNWHGYN